MQKEYVLVSPSLDGVLTHESLMYEGVSRPLEILRAFDKAPKGDRAAKYPHGKKLLERYFYDLYGIFMKKLSAFVVETKPEEEDMLKLQAILQEMIKVKKFLC